jgi:chemotaxis regulatin CheY-phosphate phosphatase CheZ
MIETAKGGDISEDLAGQFGRNLKALEELESVAELLSNSMLHLRSSWEQYARSIVKAQKMRELIR